MRIALGQIDTRAADFECNARRMEELSQKADESGADLVVFPMAALTGPQPPDFVSQEGFLLDLSDTLVGMSDAVSCPCVVPVVTIMDEEPLLEAMLLEDGAVTPLRLASMLSEGVSEAFGAPYGGGGAQAPIRFEFKGLRFALAFTYDDLDVAISSGEPVDVMLYIPVYGYALDDAGSVLGSSLAENRFRGDARALDAWFLAAGSVGGYGTQVFCGSSFILAPDGEVVDLAPAFEEALIGAEVAPAASFSAASSFSAPFSDEVYNRSLHLWEALSLGLRDFMAKQGVADAALVLKDSLTSLLLAVLASDALGPRHVRVLAGWGDRDADKGTAKRLAESLGLEVCDPGVPETGERALRHDLLEASLAALGRATGALTLSEQDKTFLALEARPGCCKGSSLLPFGDVYRSDLIELAHMRNTISPVIPREAYSLYGVPDIGGLREAEPSDEARLRRVDVTLSSYIEWERSLTDCAARQGMPELTERIVHRLHEGSAARCEWPPYLVMSSRTLFDARTPLGLAWEDRMREKEERLRGGELLRQISGEPALSVDVPGDGGDLSAMLEGLVEGVDEGPAKEILGLLRDMVQNGGQTQQPGPFGPMTWGNPFSEN